MRIITCTNMNASVPSVIDPAMLMHLFQLTDSACPVGTFSFSNGLESAAAEGLVYDFFDGELVQDAPEGPFEEWYVSCDYGTSNPTSMGLWGRKTGVWYRVAEYYYDARKAGRQKTDREYAEDLKALGGNAAEEYPDYLGQCASLDENLGRLVARLKEKGLYENTVILFASDHGSHFLTRNRDEHLNGYDDYKRSCHDACLHVPLVIAGGPLQGGAWPWRSW